MLIVFQTDSFVRQFETIVVFNTLPPVVVQLSLAAEDTKAVF